MITNLRRQRSARTAPIQASIRGRLGSVPGIRDVAVESASDGRDEHTLKLSMLEAEVLDDRRRDRDHRRKLAEPSEPKPEGAGRKTWFCGRASAGA